MCEHVKTSRRLRVRCLCPHIVRPSSHSDSHARCIVFCVSWSFFCGLSSLSGFANHAESKLGCKTSGDSFKLGISTTRYRLPHAPAKPFSRASCATYSSSHAGTTSLSLPPQQYFERVVSRPLFLLLQHANASDDNFLIYHFIAPSTDTTF